MTAITLLIICLSAQVLIAAVLGVYLLKRHLRQRREKKASPPADDQTSSD